MKKNFFLNCIIALLVYFPVSAQKQKIQFQSKNAIGISIGQSGSSLLFQTINGIGYKNFYSGIGFGIDYYNYNSYPLFFDQRIFFGKKNNVFLYGDLGYNLSGKNKPGKESYYYNSYHFSGGVYTDLGMGYRFKMHKRASLTFSSGFTYKEINNKVGLSYPCYSAMGCPVDYQNYKYGNGRVVLKAGVDF